MSAAYSMLKLAKRMEKIRNPIGADRVAYFALWEGRGGFFVYILISP